VRICHVSNLYPPDVLGGAEIVVEHMVHGLRAAGHEVAVMATVAPSRAGREEVEGVPVHRVSSANLYWVGKVSRRSRVLKLLWHFIDLWNPVMYRRVRALFRAEKFDVVHTHNLPGFSLAVWAAARTEGLPVVHTTHDHSLTCVRSIRMTRQGRVCERPCMGCAVRGRWFCQLSRSVNAVVAPTRFVLDRHLELGFFPRAVSAVVPWGVPLLEPTPHRFRGNPGAPIRFLYIGGLRPYKGIDNVLDAFRRAPGLRASLDIAGAGELAGACAEAASDPRIRFHGFVTGEQKTELFRSSDVLLFPSLCWEAFGLVALEALSYGVPVLASRTGGIPELIEEGRTGFLVEPGDPAALARGMARLAAAPAVAESMRAACQARARDLSVERTVSGIVEVYEAARGARR
jgi:glycosyltransferase involved in cell wall biosynthesis